MTPEIMTVGEIAQRWRCNPTTVYALLQSGKLKGFKLGRGVRVARAEVERYERGEQ